MFKISLEPSKTFFIDELPLRGSMKGAPGEITLLIGDNGIGKSSFFQYLKLNQKSLFGNKRCNFLNQLRMTPVNDVSFNNILQNLKSYQVEKISFFDKNIKLLDEFSTKPLNELSGGQNQLIKIFISAYLGGDIFLFDEPLQFLDEFNREIFIKYLKELKTMNKTVFIIEHHYNLLENLVDNKYELTKGEQGIILGGPIGN